VIILGIDPGLARVGFGLIETGSNQIKMLDCGIIKTNKSESEGERMVEIAKDLSELIQKWQPNLAAVEKFFFYKSSTTISVVQARGVLIMTLARFKIPIVEFPPMQIKLAVAGSGHAKNNHKKINLRLLIQSQIGYSDHFFQKSYKKP
jgi:crossover junction endodeoxyribonuclease RuvC